MSEREESAKGRGQEAEDGQEANDTPSSPSAATAHMSITIPPSTSDHRDDTGGSENAAGSPTATTPPSQVSNQASCASADQSVARVMLEKTELAPILEDQVLEIEPTPVAAAATPDDAPAPSSTSVMNMKSSSDLAPVYEVDEPGSSEASGAAGRSTPQHAGPDTASLAAPYDDAVSIATSVDWHRQRSVVGGHADDFSAVAGTHLLDGRDDDDEDDDAPNLPYQGAPNGGYGWVIVTVAFLSFMVSEGSGFSFGVLFPEFIEYFHTEESKAAWVSSVSTGCSFFMGPIASFLANKYGMKFVCVAGCVSGALGLGLSIVAPNIYVLIFSWGVLFGIATTLISLPCLFALSLWFDTKRGLATGLGISGGGWGSMLFPQMASLLIAMSGWKMAVFCFLLVYLFFTFVAVMLKPVPAVTIVDSAMNLSDIEEQADMNVFHNPGRLRLQAFRKPAFSINSTANNSMWHLSQENITGGQTSAYDITTIGRSQVSLENSHNMVHGPKMEKPEVGRKLSSYSNFMQHFLWNQHRKSTNFMNHTEDSGIAGSTTQNIFDSTANSIGNSKAENLNKVPIPPGSPGGPTDQAADGNQTSVGKRDSIERRLVPPRRPLRRMDLFYSGSTLNLELAPRSIINLNRSYWTMYPGRDTLRGAGVDETAEGVIGSSHMSKHSAPSSSGGSSSPTSLVAQMLNLKLMKQMSFSVFALAFFVFTLGLYIPYVYLPKYSVESLSTQTAPLSQQKANVLIPVIGVSNAVGRVVAGLVGDMRCAFLKPCYLTSLSLIVCGVATCLVPFLHSYLAFVIYALVFGFFLAAAICMRSLVLVSLVGLENLTSAFGLLFVMQGSGSLIGLPLASTLSDVLSSSNLPFLLSGAAFLVAGVLCLPLNFIAVWEIRRFERNKALSELEADEELEQAALKMRAPLSPAAKKFSTQLSVSTAMGLGSLIAMPTGFSNEASPVRVKGGANSEEYSFADVHNSTTAAHHNTTTATTPCNAGGKAAATGAKLPFSSPSFTNEMNLETTPEENEEKNLS